MLAAGLVSFLSTHLSYSFRLSFLVPFLCSSPYFLNFLLILSFLLFNHSLFYSFLRVFFSFSIVLSFWFPFLLSMYFFLTKKDNNKKICIFIDALVFPRNHRELSDKTTSAGAWPFGFPGTLKLENRYRKKAF